VLLKQSRDAINRGVGDAAVGQQKTKPQPLERVRALVRSAAELCSLCGAYLPCLAVSVWALKSFQLLLVSCNPRESGLCIGCSPLGSSGIASTTHASVDLSSRSAEGEASASKFGVTEIVGVVDPISSLIKVVD